jgi:predicted dehydrogenase
MAKALRAGIIGCGNVAMGHARILSGLDGVSVVGIADPTPARRKKMQDFLHLDESACYADYADLLTHEVDYVVVATPQHIRRPIIESCAKTGVHVLSEKPIATIPADAQAMIEVMRSAGLRYGVNHNYLYFAEYELVRQLIGEGAIGKIRHITLNFLGVPDYPGAAEYKPAWRHDPVAAGGGILMDMIHAVYLAEYLFGGPICGVSALIDNLDHPGDKVEDFTIVNYVLDSGYVTINMWWGNGPGGVEISGTEGRIMVFYERYGTGPFTKMESFTLVNAKGQQTFDPRSKPRDEPFVRIHKDFVDAILTERDPVAPGEAGMRALQATLAAYASGVTARFITLPLSPGNPVYQRGVGAMKELDVWKNGSLYKQDIFGLSG